MYISFSFYVPVLLLTFPQKLDELADSNRNQLNVALSAVIGKVAEEFDHTSAAHSAVKKLVTRYILCIIHTFFKIKNFQYKVSIFLKLFHFPSPSSACCE